MKRISYTVPVNSLIMPYSTLVEPYIRYCITVWGHCGQEIPNKLQILLNRAARIVTRTQYADANHESLMKDLNWVNVNQLAEYQTITLMFKVKRNLFPESTVNMFGNITERLDLLLQVAQKSITYAGSTAWNKIYNHVKESQSLKNFQMRIKNYFINRDCNDILVKIEVKDSCAKPNVLISILLVVCVTILTN